MSRIPIIGQAAHPTEWKVWPDFVVEKDGAMAFRAASPVSAVLQSLAGLALAEVMDDGGPSPLAPDEMSIDDYLVRDFKKRLTRVRVKLMGTGAVVIVAMRTCRTCGCCEDKACKGGCSWVAPDLCSKCQMGSVS